MTQTNAKRVLSPVAHQAASGELDMTNRMLDLRYLRQSSSLIQDALQKGFDVLQLANGDIVTTGTRTVVHRYSWDEEKGKLVRRKPEANRKPRRLASSAEEEDIREDA
jgi:hypothetical protein